MKRILLLPLAAVLFTACNQQTESTTSDSDSMATTTMAPPATEPVAARSPAEGDVTYSENRVQVWRGNSWADADADVTLDNGVVIRRDGKAVREGREIEMEDGVVIDRSGNVFDRAGQSIENAWESTKVGVRQAGQEIGETAEQVGRDVRNAVDDPND